MSTHLLISVKICFEIAISRQFFLKSARTSQPGLIIELEKPMQRLQRI